MRLADLLAGEGRIDEAIVLLRAVWGGSRQLADLLTRQGRTDEAIAFLRVRADQGDREAAGWLAELLAQEDES